MHVRQRSGSHRRTQGMGRILRGCEGDVDRGTGLQRGRSRSVREAVRSLCSAYWLTAPDPALLKRGTWFDFEGTVVERNELKVGGSGTSVPRGTRCCCGRRLHITCATRAAPTATGVAPRRGPRHARYRSCAYTGIGSLRRDRRRRLLSEFSSVPFLYRLRQFVVDRQGNSCAVSDRSHESMLTH